MSTEWLPKFVSDALAAHGVRHDVSSDGNAVLENGLSIRSAISEQHDHGDMHVVRFDFQFSGGPLAERYVNHCFAGFGASVEAARRDGAETFLRATFHVVLEALGGHACDEEQTSWETWSGGRDDWTVGIGPLLRKANRELGPIPSSALLDGLKTAFLEERGGGAQFIDVFFAFLDGARIGDEVKLNGDPWPRGQAALEAWVCPPAAGYLSGRMVLIALPSPQTRRIPRRPS